MSIGFSHRVMDLPIWGTFSNLMSEPSNCDRQALDQSGSGQWPPEGGPWVFHAGHAHPIERDLNALGRFVIQPGMPCFSKSEQICLLRSLAGEFAVTSNDYLFGIALDDRTAGATPGEDALMLSRG